MVFITYLFHESGHWTFAVIVLTILFLILWKSSRIMKLNMKAIGLNDLL